MSSHNIEDRTNVALQLENLEREIGALSNEVGHSSYNLAKRQASEIVECEANPTWFLSTERHDIPATAKRIILYWRQRTSLFGEDKYLHRTTFTSGGTMDRSDLAALQDGFISVLPEDVNGNYVLYVDESKIESNHSVESRLRTMFYILTVLSAREESHSDCKISIIFLVKKLSFDFAFLEKLRQLLDGMPIRILRYHIVHLTSDSKDTNIKTQVIPKVIEALTGGASVAPHAHIGSTSNDILGSLLPFGFSAPGIPQDIGGSWDAMEMILWLKWRIDEEEGALGTKLSPLTKEVLENAYSEDNDDQENEDEVDDDDDHESQSMDSNELVETYARKSVQTYDTVSKLDDSGKIDTTSKFKIGPNDDPNTVPIDRNESKEEMEKRVEILRKRNAVYSKRKYYKKKREVERLDHTRIDLETTNRRLKQENLRLESLVTSASKIMKLEEAIRGFNPGVATDVSTGDITSSLLAYESSGRIPLPAARNVATQYAPFQPYPPFSGTGTPHPSQMLHLSNLAGLSSTWPPNLGSSPLPVPHAGIRGNVDQMPRNLGLNIPNPYDSLDPSRIDRLLGDRIHGSLRPSNENANHFFDETNYFTRSDHLRPSATSNLPFAIDRSFRPRYPVTGNMNEMLPTSQNLPNLSSSNPSYLSTSAGGAALPFQNENQRQLQFLLEQNQQRRQSALLEYLLRRQQNDDNR